MTKKTLYILGIILTIIVGMILNWLYCCNISSPAEIPAISEEIEAPTNPLEIRENDGSFSYNNPDNFNFKTSGFDIVSPVATGVQKGVDSVRNYLASHNTKYIHITGLYLASEENLSPYPNLGIARATHVKNYFVSNGVPSNQVITNGELKENLTTFNDMLYGPVEFEITSTGEHDEESLQALLEKIQNDPLIIYFEYGESRIDLSAEQRHKVADISDYLDKVSGAVCHITGHTDNTSSEEFNYELGLKRAKFLKDYFVTHGIPADKITTDSKGETEPIADNTSDEGKAKNRRTVLTINKQN
ncbi:OmpA family protein [Zhouia amylolytica]|uniref:OmpA family protein n=1 Tax=Zhouia amylolytica TaxID=376730 RepID=A0A1I6SLJ6_9FLAO|nr:OmpA family protein [Zhouia amylolytica]SFS77813.1 OmpA family protein [Zhouia amylolytica]